MNDGVQGPLREPEAEEYITLVGRDPARTPRVMAMLWSHATTRGLRPAKWRLGLFNLRDALAGKPIPPRLDNPRQLWGAEVSVVGLSDVVELVAFDPTAERGQEFVTIIFEEESDGKQGQDRA